MVANIVFKNGKVLTVDKFDTRCEAVAVKDGKIVFCGGNSEADNYVAGMTEVIDLRGRTLIPGFIDAHLHMGVMGMNAAGVDCRYPHVKSIGDIQKKIAAAAKNLPPGAWIRGWGYDHSKLAEKRHPVRAELDEAAPNNPVYLVRTCAHISSNNSKALAVAGISDGSPEIPGGEMERNPDGSLNGVMKENAHMVMVKAALPSKAELMDAFGRANKMLLAEGITSVHDSGGYGEMQLEAQREAVEKGIIDIKINAILFSFVDNIDFVKAQIEKGPRNEENTDHFRIGPVKLMIDGSSSGPTAATFEPYCSNPDSCGIIAADQALADEIMMKAHEKGFQLTSHAVGDKGVDIISRAIERALEAIPKKDHRNRIEHCAIINDELLARIKRLGIVPIPQPIFLYEFGDGYVVNYGENRVNNMFTCRRFIDEGVIQAGSSDCPITFSNPLMGIHLAVNRITQSGQKISQGERISKMDALRLFTYNGAYAAFEEDKKGSIEVGKAADLVVLNGDYENCADDKIMDMKVDMTFIDGKLLYER